MNTNKSFVPCIHGCDSDCELCEILSTYTKKTCIHEDNIKCDLCDIIFSYKCNTIIQNSLSIYPCQILSEFSDLILQKSDI